MRNKYQRINCIFHFLGNLLGIIGIILLIPLILVLIYWGQYGESWTTVYAFVIPSLVSLTLCFTLRKLFKPEKFDMTSSMLICALSWIFISVVGALPFVIGINASYLNAYFEAMSGFTTAGITVFSGLDKMPRSILFWRSLTQWLGGTGILSFFLIIMSQGGGIHHVFSAESHKISSGRIAPGLFHTLKIVWGIYGGFTLLAMTVYALEGMTIFDSVCHALTTLPTGGFSPHDSSIEFYKLSGHTNYKLIEYSVTFFMMLGGINFLIHYRLITGDFKALWDNLEIRYWWRFIAGFVIVIMLDHLYKGGVLGQIIANPSSINLAEIENLFRHTIFQVMSIMTTTGFVTKDIGSSYFPELSKQLFLVMMFIGGCVGSTGCGFKVLRIAILHNLIYREIFKLRVSGLASSGLVVDKTIVPDDEVYRVAGLFFVWIALILLGGGITALFSSHNAWSSLSGMFSALGNIGPMYISVQDMINIHPIVKITYIFGMLVGRLEILPVLLLFSRKAWR